MSVQEFRGELDFLAKLDLNIRIAEFVAGASGVLHLAPKGGVLCDFIAKHYDTCINSTW